MSASSAFSGKSAEPIVTEPGAVGRADDDAGAAADVDAADVVGGVPVLEVLELPLLPLLPQAARVSIAAIGSAAAATFRAVVRFMGLLGGFSRWSRTARRRRWHRRPPMILAVPGSGPGGARPGR